MLRKICLKRQGIFASTTYQNGKTIMEKSILEKKLRKKKFPIGIFLMLFLTQSVIAAGATAFYFYSASKSKIQDIEQYGRNFSITLAEAFADVAELSHRSGNYSKLKSLIQEKIGENIINEGFFVLKDGKLIVHSDKAIEKSLKGNIATDEFTYNIEMILWPLKKKTAEVMFTPYNIMGKRVPFNRDEKRLIREYLYKDINTLGWLVSRGVYSKGKPVGTVNFLIYNDRVFEYIRSQIETAKKAVVYAVAGAFALSLLVSLVVLIRYRSIQKKTILLAPGEGPVPRIEQIQREKGRKVVPISAFRPADEEVVTIMLDDGIKGPAPRASNEEQIDAARKPLSIRGKTPSGPAVRSEQAVLDMGREIRDAIPIARKR